MKTFNKVSLFFTLVALVGLAISIGFNSDNIPPLDSNTIAPFLILVLFPFVVFLAVKMGLAKGGATNATQNH